MAIIKYITGDATAPIEDGYKLIIHICNDIGAWGRGFVLAISKRWKEPERAYRTWKYLSFNRFTLGAIQEIIVEPDISVINMVAQHGVRFDKDGKPPIRLEALSKCLDKVLVLAKQKNCSIHAPRIGCGLGGCNNWLEIEKLLIEKLVNNGINVTIYDLPKDND